MNQIMQCYWLPRLRAAPLSLCPSVVRDAKENHKDKMADRIPRSEKHTKEKGLQRSNSNGLPVDRMALHCLLGTTRCACPVINN